MRPTRWLLPLLAATLALPAAAGPGRAGLWEVSTMLNLGIGGLQIAPGQIEQMRAFGLEVPGLSRPFVARQCITPAQAAADGLPTPQAGDSGCRLRNVRHQGAIWTADIACAGSLQGSGSMRARFDGDRQFSGDWAFHGRSTTVPGELDLSNPFSGRWLGTRCGR